jgi:integrase
MPGQPSSHTPAGSATTTALERSPGSVPGYTAADFELDEDAWFNVTRSLADNTRRTYRAQWNEFVFWCVSRKPPVVPIPATPQTVANHLAYAARHGGLKNSSIRLRLSAISAAHRSKGYGPDSNPARHDLVRKTVQGIERTRAETNDARGRVNRKHALTRAEIEQMCEALPADRSSAFRDRAILLLGLATGLRRSNIAALRVEHVRFSPSHEHPVRLELTIVRSKTDPLGRGRVIALNALATPKDRHLCPVLALRDWIREAGIRDGFVFRRIFRGDILARPDHGLSDRSISDILKRCAERAGLEVSIADISGHSLRRGMITGAIRKGVAEFKIMRLSGHRSVQTLRSYIEESGDDTADVAGAVLASPDQD